MEENKDAAAPEYDFSQGELAEKAAQLRALIGAEEEKSEEVAEVDAPVAQVEPSLDDLDIDPAMLHLYKRAKIEQTAEGPRFVVPYHEFTAVTKNYASGKIPQLDANGEPRNIGDYITMMVNGPDGWRLSALLPNGSGMCAAIFERTVPLALPTPEPLNKTEVTPPPTENDLAGLAARASEWAAGTKKNE